MRGTVEDVTLRVTTVRTIDGEVVITPNGQITQVTQDHYERNAMQKLRAKGFL